MLIPYPDPMNRLRLVADRPSLNFANTVDPRQGGGGVDYLLSYDGLAQWGSWAGVVPKATAARLAELAGKDPAGAKRALDNARRLREAIYRIFSAVALRRRPPAPDIAVVQAAFSDSLKHATFERFARSFRWRLSEDLELISWNVAHDAVALLESDLLGRIKRCPGSGDCGWLFLDTSKNRSRRWCSMAGCGNRAKARRHARRNTPLT